VNLVFMGTPSFAVPSLERLVGDGHRIASVVTAPEKKRGRGQKLSDTPVGLFARSRGIPILRPSDLSQASFRDDLTTLSPDCIVVVAFRILPEVLFSIPSSGIFNLHASLLPRYRGAAPIQWAILNGDMETGVTTFLLKKRVDTGGILLQERISISPDETGGELHDRLAVLGADVVSRTVRMLETGVPTVVEQDESLVTHARKLRKTDMLIDWNRSAREVHNLIRAFSPEPGAWTTLHGKTFKIFRSGLVPSDQDTALAPGTVIRASKAESFVQCGTGSIVLHEVMSEGRKRMPIAEFLRGYSIESGTVLSSPG